MPISDLHFIDTSKTFPVRYDLGKLLKYDGRAAEYDILLSQFIRRLKGLVSSNIRIVRRDEEFDLALIAFRVFGDTQFWWVLVEFNNVVNFDDIKEGVELAIPSVTDLERIYFELKNQERKLNRGSDK